MDAELTPKQWEQRLALCLAGPFNPVPEGAPCTLEELRRVNWDRMSRQERSALEWRARALLAEIERQGYVLVKRSAA